MILYLVANKPIVIPNVRMLFPITRGQRVIIDDLLFFSSYLSEQRTKIKATIIITYPD